MRAWRKADTLDAPGRCKSWLYRIATNVCLDMLERAAAARAADGPRPAVTADAALDAGLPEESGCCRCPTSA